jgi:transposase
VFEETWNTDLSAIEAEVEHLQDNKPCDTVTKPKRPRAGRQPLPAHLPRIEHHHEPESCTCETCGKDLVKIREDITEQLDVKPAKFLVHRPIRSHYACKSCETITAASSPPAVIDGGLAAVGLLAWVMISKYQDHLPLYRLQQIAARDRVSLSRPTLAEWTGRIGVALQSLVNRLTWHLLQGNTLCMLTKLRWRNWIPATAKPRKPTCGPTAAMIWPVKAANDRFRLPTGPKR